MRATKWQLKLRILELYGLALPVDLGKPGLRQFGVPPRGAFDPTCYRLGNALVGNADETPALELSLAALRLGVLEGGPLGWVGAGAWQGVRAVAADETLELSYPAEGARSYLSAPGGWQAIPVLEVGSVLSSPNRFVEPASLDLPSPDLGPIRVYRGTHADQLDWNSFIRGEFEVGHDSNRMGVRLRPTSPNPHSLHLTSEPTDVGVIQLPASGNPIILGPDGPTIGGYPRIAQVIRVDLPRVAQLAPKSWIRFQEVSREQGLEILRESEQRLVRRLTLLRSRTRL